MAHPEAEFEAGDTVVWSPVFQAAWDAVNGELGGKPTESGSELGKRLDDFEWRSAEVLPEGRWKVWSGPSTPALHREANAGARELTGDGEVFPEIRGLRDEEGAPVSYAAYALLDVELLYARPLYRSKQRPMTFTDAEGKEGPVHFFGVRGKASSAFGNIRVLHRGGKSHALEIPARDLDRLGSLLLFLPEEPLSFAKACEQLRAYRASWPHLPEDWRGERDPRFHERDQLRVPLVSFEARSDFRGDLKGLRIYPGVEQPYVIAEAWQDVDFRLHEKGAEVRVEAGVGMDPFGSPPKPPEAFPRDFSFDRPFFAMLWRDGAKWPYFAAWVGGREAMELWR